MASYFKLSMLDQFQLAPWYIRMVICFPFVDETKRDGAIEQLKEGLSATFKELPVVAGYLVPESEAEFEANGRQTVLLQEDLDNVIERGYLQIEHLDRLTAGRSDEQIGASSTQQPLNYEDLARDGMPSVAMQGNVGIVPSKQSGDKPPAHLTPIMRVKAAFVRGGLFLSVYIHHTVCDGVGMSVVLERFAANVRNGLGHKHEIEDDFFEREARCRAYVTSLAASPCLKIPPCPEIWVDDPPSQPYLNSALRGVVPVACRLFFIDAAYLDSIKETINAYSKQIHGNNGQNWVSTRDCLSAIIWSHVTRARGLSSESSSSRLLFPVDFRARLKPSLPSKYIGNACLMTTAERAVHDLNLDHMSEGNAIVQLGKTALAIRRALQSFDQQFVRDRLALLASLKHARGAKPSVDFEFGHGLFLNFWDTLGEDIDWGIKGTGGDGRHEFIRKGHGITDGVCTVLPRRSSRDGHGKQAPWVCQIGLKEEHMTRMCDEHGLASLPNTKVTE